MSEYSEETIEFSWVVPGLNVWPPLRVVVRLTSLILWILGCFAAYWCLTALALFSRPLSRKLRKGLSRKWIRGMSAILGLRLLRIGRPPDRPYFLVVNHISWVDLFAMYSLCDAVSVLQAEDEKLPFIGTLMKGLSPIFIRRHRDDVPRGIALITEAIERGDNLLLAPEGVVSPGREVRHFHAALLDAAVQTKCPVHYGSITCRTPEGCPPASEAVLFGPDPFYLTPDGKIPQSELDAWGPERSFFTHLLGLLALPWHEVVVKFAPEPISGTDRVTLAKDLRDAVQGIFTPVE